jgi:hypothetical protein
MQRPFRSRGEIQQNGCLHALRIHPFETEPVSIGADGQTIPDARTSDKLPEFSAPVKIDRRVVAVRADDAGAGAAGRGQRSGIFFGGLCGSTEMCCHKEGKQGVKAHGIFIMSWCSSEYRNSGSDARQGYFAYGMVDYI